MLCMVLIYDPLALVNRQVDDIIINNILLFNYH